MHDFSKPELLTFFEYFLKKHSKQNYCILVTTTNGIIKGTPTRRTNNDYDSKLKFNNYVNDLNQFINWYNTMCLKDLTNVLLVPKDDPNKLHPHEVSKQITENDILIFNDVTLYIQGKEVELPSYLVFPESIIGVSIVPKDFSLS